MPGVYTPGEPVVLVGSVAGSEIVPADTAQSAGAGNATIAVKTGADGLGSGVQIIAAAGSTQLGATAVNPNATIVLVTVTASTEGVRLPTAATGRRFWVVPQSTVGVKVYPTSHQFIAAGASNAAVTVAASKSVMFVAFDKTHWRVLTSA